MFPNIDQTIEVYRRNGPEKERSGNLTGAFDTYTQLLDATLHKVISSYEVQEGIRNLKNSVDANVIAALKVIHHKLGQDIGKETFGPGMISGIGLVQLVTLSHIFWLLEDRSFGESLLQAAARPPFLGQAGKFWTEYVRAFVSLTKHEAYEPKLPKITGIEKHWAAYIPLISDLTNQRPVNQSLQNITDSFERANRDKRIHDACFADPSGHHPVKWDFRLEAIRWYAGQAYGIQF
jgi:hypothetical protein